MKEYIITVDESKPDIMGSVPLMEPPKELIRCEDCKHLFDGEHTNNCCVVLMEKTGWLKEISVCPDWFCADGEKLIRKD